MADAVPPRLVLIIRHGEKPGPSGDDKGGGPHLSIRGSARAAALPSLFVPGVAPAAAPRELCCDMANGAPGGQFLGKYDYGTLPASPSRFPTPHKLFATESSHASHRPRETVTPLAEALRRLRDPAIDSEVHHGFANTSDGIQQLIGVVQGSCAGLVVLICWHHGSLPALVQAFGVPARQLAGWSPFPSSVFDVVMQIAWSGGQAALTVARQQLLFGDSP